MITAIIITKNEEKNIVGCLESLNFCSECIVIDDLSADRTRDLARLNGATVIERRLDGNFSDQRNHGLKLAKTDWVLFIDADERVSEKLANEIKSAVAEEKFNGYLFKRVDKLFGRVLKYGEAGNIKLLRLGKKSAGKWNGLVHETWDIKGETGTLKNSLFHAPHASISDFLSEISFYSTLRAKELKSLGEGSSWFTIILYTKGKFFYTYIIKLGFLDGMPGLLLSIMMSFHSFLTRSKLYLLNRK
jgi:glycosyltransferase involved in cell wall biosynthesis